MVKADGGDVVRLKGVETARVSLEAFNFGGSESQGHVQYDLQVTCCFSTSPHIARYIPPSSIPSFAPPIRS